MVSIAARLLPAMLLAAVALKAGQSLAQGSGSSRLSPPRQTRPQTPAEFQQSFWRHITVTSPYRQWTRFGANEQDPRPGEDPHGPWVKTYVNAVATKNPARLEYGSVIVNEELDDDKSTLRAVSVMYCVKGADPTHYDWYWLKYTPDGKVVRAPAEQGGKPIAGKVQRCIQCHRKAKADLVFSNDELHGSTDVEAPKRD